MKKRKLIAGLLTFCLVLTNLPFAGLAVFADTTPVSKGNSSFTYKRLQPEVAIMNAYTGNNEAFYTSVQNDANFNFAESISSLGYSKKISDDCWRTYPDFGKTVLNRLSNSFFNQMEASYSATFHNKNGHSHYANMITIDTSYIASDMYIGGTRVVSPSGWGGISSKETRQGKGVFGKYYQGASDIALKIQYTNSVRYYSGLLGKEYTCTCGGDAYNHTIVFRDAVAPSVSMVEVLDESGNAKSEFKGGDKIVIKIYSTEPLRLANDAVPTNDICVGLKVDGGDKDDQLIAVLTGLELSDDKAYYWSGGTQKYFDCSVMTFKLSVPSGINEKITGIDLSPTKLTGKQVPLYDKNGGIDLRQVKKGGSFTVAKTTADGIGFTKTNSYITDLAGNALSSKDISCKFYIDSESPYVAQVSASADTHNSAVKDALGKTSMDPSDPLYVDASDRYLGIGDSICFYVLMNELVTPNLASYWSSYPDATIHTNLLDKNGAPVTVTSTSAYKTKPYLAQLGKGSSDGYVTQLYFNALTIEEGMYTCDGSDKIKITDVEFSNAPADRANNSYNGSADILSVNQDYRLDLIAPQASNSTGAVTASYDSDAYVFEFTVTDNVAEGTAALKGSFIWSSGITYPFEYALTSSVSEPAEWTRSTMGNSISFIQTGASQYLHLRPIEGETYELDNSKLCFTLYDYAGNKGTTQFKLDGSDYGAAVIFDNVAPRIVMGNVTRVYDNGQGKGTLTVNIEITDNNISADNQPEYIWADADAVVTAESQGWLPLTGSIDGSNRAFSVSQSVNKGEKFEKRLFVKAGDTKDNVTVASMGAISYNLKSVAYSLDYSTSVRPYADIKVTSIDTDDAILFFYIDCGNGECFGKMITSADKDPNIFSGCWNVYSMSESDGNKIFTYEDPIYVSKMPYSQYLKSYTGRLKVNVAAGNSSAIQSSGNDLTINNSASFEELTLSILETDKSYWPFGNTSYTDVLEDYLDIRFTNVSGAVLDKYVISSYDAPWTPENGIVLKSLAGLTFGLNITPKEGYEWLLDDLDMLNSFVVIYKGNANNVEIITEIPLADAYSQNITLPEYDYGKGEVHIQCLLRRADDSGLCGNLAAAFDAFIDDTEASDAFELEHVIHTYHITTPGSSYTGNLVQYNSYYPDFGLSKEDIFVDMPVDRTPVIAENEEDEITPITVPYYYYDGWEDWYSDIYLAFTSDEPAAEQSYFGQSLCNTGLSVLQAWNITSGSGKVYLDKYFVCDPASNGFMRNTSGHGGRLQLKIAEDSVTANALDAAGSLGVIKDQVNFIAVQAIYENGTSSSIKYYAVMPVEGDTASCTVYSDGEDTGDKHLTAGSEVVFDVQFSGLGQKTVYATGYDYDNKLTTDLEELELLDDGTYAYNANPDEYMVFFSAKDSYGVTFPLFYKIGYVKDKTAPVISVASPLSVDSYGTFTAKFRISDHSFKTYDSWDKYPMDSTLEIGFDDAYSELLGIGSGFCLEVPVALEYWYDTKGPDFEEGLTAANRYYDLWESEESTRSGISYVYARLDSDSRDIFVTVGGVISPRLTEGNKTDVTLNIVSSDFFGNHSKTVSTTASDVFGREPVLVGAEFKSNEGRYDDKALYLSFSAPVQPAESWINRDIDGYDTVWHDAFPITRDGVWDITFSDIFGNVYTRQITISDGTFGQYGFDLAISTTEPTPDDVTISAATDDGLDYFLTGTRNGTKIEWGGIIEGDDDPMVAEASKTRVVSADGCYAIITFDWDHSGEKITGSFDPVDYTFIYIDNVAKIAPEAELSFYFEEYGDSFTVDELAAKFPNGVSTDNFVKVSYETSRHVTADGESEHIFKYEPGQTVYSCSFSYNDDFGHIGGKVVNLSDYGIAMAAPPEPYRDNEKPIVDVNIYGKRSGAYVQSEFFSVSDSESVTASNAADAFANASYVQDYSLVLKITDYSAYRIILMDSAPDSTVSYAEAADTFNSEYVTLSGNTVHISKEYRTLGRDFWVVIIDNAKDGTGAAADNYTAFKVTKTVLEPWFDNDNPELAETREIADTLYQHTLYLKITDKADNGIDTPVSGISVSGASLFANEKTSGVYNKTDYPYCITFNSNTEVPITIRDMAGNYILRSVKPLTEIDDSVPTLNIVWSPGLVTTIAGEPVIDESQPTAGPVNTDVTAHIYSDKPIEMTTTKVEYQDYSGYYQELPSDGSHYGIYCDMTGQRVTLKFTENYSCGENIRVTVYAPNGKKSVVYTILGYDVIDKSGPSMNRNIEYLYRYGYSDHPYAFRYNLVFNEDVYVEGEDGIFGPGESYSVVLPGKSKKTITVTDLAGNVQTLECDTEKDGSGDIPDCTAPVITFIDPASGDLSDKSADNGTVSATLKCNENCTLYYNDGTSDKVISFTAGQEQKIHFTTNGTRYLYFYDDADNLTEITVTVNSLDSVKPLISMTSSTISLIEGSSDAELKALLDSGVTASDNSGKFDLSYNSGSVKLNVPGTYTVTYSAADPAGNKTEAKRFVKVISKDLPVVCIDDEILESDGVISIKPGKHKLTVSNLREKGEPYKVIFVRGIYYEGQTKYLENQFRIGTDGSFTIDTEGFYTLYVQTQSRQSLRCLVDVEE